MPLRAGFGHFITPFRKPFFLCTITFAVMCLALLSGSGSKKTSSIHALKNYPARAIGRLVPMAIFELIGCSAMLVSMIRLPASQAELLNVAGHSLFFEVMGSLVRGKSLSLLQWLGSTLVLVGTVLAGVSNTLHLGGGSVKPWFVTVVLAVLIAPLAFFARSLCEVSLGKDEGVKTSYGLFIGTQGVIGLIMQLAVVFPLISVLPGADVGNKLENIPDSLHVLGSSWPLMLLLVLYGSSVLMTSFSQREKVPDADSASREVWKLLRVALVWVLELMVFRVTHGAVGEFWFPLCWLRLASFGLLVGGMRAFHAGTGPDIEVEDAENASLIGDQGHAFKKGHHVRVKPDIDQPKWGWRKVERHSVGVICGVQSDGTVRVHFPEANSWQGDPRDLIIDPVADLIRPGTFVKLKPDVDQPSFGWGKYKPGMVGEVITVRYDGLVLLKFDWGPWKGLLNELEPAPAPKKESKRCIIC